MKEVILWDMSGAGLIIPLPTDVLFSNQVGGGGCLQRSLEGVFVPINQDTQLGDYAASLEARLASIFQGVVAIGAVQAGQINLLLSGSLFTKGITVDQTRLAESCEGWVHVIVEETEYGAIKGLEKFSAVLTWPNSD